MSSSSFFITVGSQEFGPYTEQQIRDGLSDGSIDPITQARRSESQVWQPVSALFPAMTKAYTKARSTGYRGLRTLITVTGALFVIAAIYQAIRVAGLTDRPWDEYKAYQIGATLGYTLTVLIMCGLAHAFLDIADAKGRKAR